MVHHHCLSMAFCRVFCVKFSCDATYVISGSDDTNLRLWKAKASEQLGVVRISSDIPFTGLQCVAIWKVGSQEIMEKAKIVDLDDGEFADSSKGTEEARVSRGSQEAVQAPFWGEAHCEVKIIKAGIRGFSTKTMVVNDVEGVWNCWNAGTGICQNRYTMLLGWYAPWTKPRGRRKPGGELTAHLEPSWLNPCVKEGSSEKSNEFFPCINSEGFQSGEARNQILLCSLSLRDHPYLIKHFYQCYLC